MDLQSKKKVSLKKLLTDTDNHLELPVRLSVNIVFRHSYLYDVHKMICTYTYIIQYIILHLYYNMN